MIIPGVRVYHFIIWKFPQSYIFITDEFLLVALKVTIQNLKFNKTNFG